MTAILSPETTRLLVEAAEKAEARAITYWEPDSINPNPGDAPHWHCVECDMTWETKRDEPAAHGDDCSMATLSTALTRARAEMERCATCNGTRMVIAKIPIRTPQGCGIDLVREPCPDCVRAALEVQAWIKQRSAPQ